MSLSAVIFDLNGTVLDDEHIYGAAFGEILKELGAKDVTDNPQTKGIGVKENWPQLLKKYKLKADKTLDELARLTQREYLSHLSDVTLMNGFEEFATSLRESGVKLALATSNEWWIVEKVFDELDLEGTFDVTVTKEEVSRNKPDPEMFLLASEKLGFTPELCVVIEDAEAGVQAAREAGMKVVGIAATEEDEKLLKKADLLVKDFKELMELAPEIARDQTS